MDLEPLKTSIDRWEKLGPEKFAALLLANPLFRRFIARAVHSHHRSLPGNIKQKLPLNEATQEVMTRILRDVQAGKITYGGKGKLSGFFNVIVKHKLVDVSRMQKVREINFAFMDFIEEHSDDATGEDYESEIRRLRHAIQELKSRAAEQSTTKKKKEIAERRNATLHLILSNCSNVQIARQLGVSTKTVERDKQYLISKLRHLMVRKGRSECITNI